MSFKSDMEKANRKIQNKMSRVFRGTALDLFGKVILRTPVDTGRLRGNWYATINIPSQKVDAEGEGYQTIVAKAKLGDALFITNNLPYAIPIEQGSSDQAPAGMVEVTANEFLDVAGRQAKKK